MSPSAVERGWGGDNGTALFRSKAESFNGEQSRAWHNSVHELKIETPPLTTEHMLMIRGRLQPLFCFGGFCYCFDF